MAPWFPVLCYNSDIPFILFHLSSYNFQSGIMRGYRACRAQWCSGTAATLQVTVWPHSDKKKKTVLLTVEEFSRWIFVFINLIFTQIFLVFLRKFTAFYYWVIFWSNFAFPVACGTTKIFASAVYVGMYINIDICTITYVGVSRLYSFGGNIQNYKRANSVVKRHVLTGTWCNSSLWSLLWPYANHIISGNILIFLVSDCEATF